MNVLIKTQRGFSCLTFKSEGTVNKDYVVMEKELGINAETPLKGYWSTEFLFLVNGTKYLSRRVIRS